MYEPNAAEVHERSVALMRFLARVATASGVGDHVYVVGGAVRNWVLGEPIKDIDLVIDSVAAGSNSESFARSVARATPVPTSLVTNQYGVAILTIKDNWMLDGYDMRGEVIEIANARAESYTKTGDGKGYKPSDVRPATIEEDVYRREFRFNTLLWRLADLEDGPQDAEIIDITGKGLSDLRVGRICTPSDPDVTFSDDPTRMLRAMKFALRYDLEIPAAVADSIRRNAGQLHEMPWEPVASLFVNNVLRSDKALEGLPMLHELGLLDVLLELASRERAVRVYLTGQLRGERRPELLVLLLEAGFQLDLPVARLTQEERARLLEICAGMSDDEAAAYLGAVEKPPVDNRKIISALSLPPEARGRIAGVARRAVLSEPSLADDPVELTRRVLDLWGSYTPNSKLGIVLDEQSAQALLAWWAEEIGPLLPVQHSHHVTLGGARWLRSMGVPLAADVTLRVVGVAADENGQAVLVESPVPSVNQYPHVTVATAKGVAPVYSNELLERGAAPVRGPSLRGWIGEIP